MKKIYLILGIVFLLMISLTFAVTDEDIRNDNVLWLDFFNLPLSSNCSVSAKQFLEWGYANT